MNLQDNGLKSNPSSSAPAPATPPTVTETVRTSIFLPPMLQSYDQGPPLPPALCAPPTAASLWQAFRRRWVLAVVTGLLAAALTVLAVQFLFPARFAGNFCVKVNSTKSSNPILDRNEDPDFQVFKALQAALCKSRPVINRALNSQVNGRYVKDLGVVRSQSDAVDWLQSGIKTDFLLAPEILRVALAADQPEEMTLLLNSLAKSLIEENRIIEENKHNAQIDQTQMKERQLQSELNLRRKVYRERIKGTVSEEVHGKKVDQMEMELKESQKAVRVKKLDLIQAENRLKSLEDRLENPDGFNVPPQIINDYLRQDPGAKTFLLAVDQATIDYNNALRVLPDPGSPHIQRYLEKRSQAERALENYRQQKLPDLVRQAREKLAAEGAGELNKLRDEVSSIKSQIAPLEKVASELESELDRIRPSSGLPLDVVNLKQEVESLEKALQRINETIAYMRVNYPSPRVSILQDAIEPSGRDTSKQFKLAGAGGLGMFFLAVLGVSFMEFRKRMITNSDEVSRGLGLTLVGTIPTLPKQVRLPVANANANPFWQNQLMESVDTIRTMLLHSARNNNTRVIMVTSASGGEGKTSLASQLAASLARAWKKTLLIDGDLRSPEAHKLFEVAQDPGLSEVLRGEVQAGDAVKSTPLSRLWVMPAGHWDSHAVQALAQDSVRTLLEELKQQYDFIILDSCPILPVADSLLLGQNVDGVILTVMRDLSRSPAIYAAQKRLEGLGIKTLGAVMIGDKSELGPLGYKYAMQARP